MISIKRFSIHMFVSHPYHNPAHSKQQWCHGFVNSLQCKPDISRSRISRNWIYRGRMLDPIFVRPRARNFLRNRGNSLDPIRGRQFFAKSAHRDSLCSRFAGDNFSRNQLKPTWSMRAGTHAVRRSATSGGALTPPLCRRVGPS